MVGAAACAAAIVLLLHDPPPTNSPPPPTRRRASGGSGRGSAPLLHGHIYDNGAWRAGLALLLLLHLQAEFDLDPGAIAFFFLPGAILLAVLPERAYGVAVRLGRSRSLVSRCSGAPSSPARLRPMLDEPLAVPLLVGAVGGRDLDRPARSSKRRWPGPRREAWAGGWASTRRPPCSAPSASPLLAGIYGGPGWRTACVVAAGSLLLGAALVPLAVRALGLPDALASQSAPPEAVE